MSFENQAAVLIALRELQENQKEVLLTLRAEHLNHHGGEVAFPGGKWEPGDKDLYATALRESMEEVGLPVDRVNYVKAMEASYTRRGVKVTPYIGTIKSGRDLSLTANQDELSAIFWLPIEVLMEDKRLRTDVFSIAGVDYWAPVYEFQGFTIWGFTSRVLVQFMRVHYGVQLQRQHQAPEKKYQMTP